MKNIVNILTIILSVLFFCTACAKVNELASGAKVEEFVIKLETVSDGVELSTQTHTIESSGTENIIYVNVSKGRYISPIAFNVFISASESAVAIIPSDGILVPENPDQLNNTKQQKTVHINNLPFSRIGSTEFENAGTFAVRFTDTDEIVVFWVIDENGMPNKWNIRLKFTELSDDALITNFKISKLSPGLVISQNPFIQESNSQIDIYVARGTFPISINPDIEVSEGAMVESVLKKNKTAIGDLLFTSYSDTSIIKIVASSGFIKEWKIALRGTKILTDINSVDADQLERMLITKENLTVTIDDNEVLLEDVNVLNDTRKVEVYLSEKQLANNAEVKLDIALVPSSQVLGATNIKFDSEGKSTHYLYMIDESSDYSLKWSVSVMKDEPNLIRVDGATFESYIADDVIVNSESNYDIDKKEIWFNVNKEQSTYNVLLNGVKCLTNRKATNTMPKTLMFTAINSPQLFTITSEDGTATEQWNIMIKYKPTSSDVKLLDFELKKTSIDWTKLHIEQIKKIITVEVNQKDKLNFTPSFKISQGATIKSENGAIGNNVPSLIALGTPTKLIITAEDGLTTDEWIIEFIYAPQLENRGFESMNQWTSANVTSPIELTGTEIINRDAANGKAIMATTKEQDALILGKLIAAGAAFKGSFDMKLNGDAIKYPRTMTSFGVPFEPTTKPVSYSIDAKYNQGAKMQQAVKGSGIEYIIQDRTGNDKGQIWMEMINYNGDMSAIEKSYSGEGKNGVGNIVADLTVVSRANLEIDSSNKQFNNWVNRHEVKLVPQNGNATITHIAFVITSSIAGDKYLGAIGSKIYADNLTINYYESESGAIIKYSK